MKEFDLIIKNGTVVTSTESFLCDVAVKDGKSLPWHKILKQMRKKFMMPLVN